MMKISDDDLTELAIRIHTYLSDIIEEKQWLIGELLRINWSLKMNFFNNENLTKALNSFNKQFNAILLEVDREHLILSKFDDYFEDIDYDLQNSTSSIVYLITEIGECISEHIQARTLEITEYTGHYDNVEILGSLTESNCEVKDYKTKTTEENTTDILMYLSQTKMKDIDAREDLICTSYENIHYLEKEKMWVIGTIIQMNSLLDSFFIHSPYLRDAIKYFNEYLTSYISCIDFEITVFEKIIVFTKKFESVEKFEHVIGEYEINNIIEELQVRFDRRVEEYSGLISKYMMIVATNSLKEDNYKTTFPHLNTPEENRELLKKISEEV